MLSVTRKRRASYEESHFSQPVVILVTAAIGVWFSGYYIRQNPDNVPSKELMVNFLREKGEAYATEKIEDYSVEDLSAIWGQPDGELFGMYGYVWESGEHFFVVYFDPEGLATQVKLGER